MLEKSDDLSLIDVLILLRDNALWVVAVPFIIGLIAVACSFLIKPTYTSGTSFLGPQQQQSSAVALLGSLSGLAAGAALGGLKNPSDQWVALLKSRTIADSLLSKFKLMERYEVEFAYQARRRLAASTKIVAGKDGLITIEVEDHDPKVAAQIATAYVQRLQEMTRTLAVGEAAQRRKFFEQQLLEAKNNLSKAEVALQQSGISPNTAKIRPDIAVETIADIRAKMASAQVRISVMRSYMQDQSPALKQAAAELASLKLQLDKAQEAEPENSTDGAAYVARYRDFKYYETLYELMAKQFEIAKVDEAREGNLIQVVDEAQVPERKSGPQRLLIGGIAAGVSALLCSLMVLIRSSIDNRRRPQRAAA